MAALIPEADCVAGGEVDWWELMVPHDLQLVRAPPLLTATPGAADFVDPVDVEAPLDPCPADVSVLEPGWVFAGPEAVEPAAAPFSEPLPAEVDEFEVDPEDVEDDPPAAG